jgi:hypothetical protein
VTAVQLDPEPFGCVACRVIAWEPVKIFQAYMEYSIARNKLQHKVNRPAFTTIGSLLRSKEQGPKYHAAVQDNLLCWDALCWANNDGDVCSAWQQH